LLTTSSQLPIQVPEDSDTVRVTVEENALWDDRMSCVVEKEVTYHHLPPSYRPPFSRILALLQVIIERYPVYDLAQHGDQWHANVFIKTIATTFPSGRYAYPKRPSKYRSLLGIFQRISCCVKPHPGPANNTSVEDVISKWERCQFLPQQLDKVFLEERYPGVNLTFEVGDAFVSPPGRDKITLQLSSSHDGSGEDMYTKLYKQLDPGPSQRPSTFGVRFSDRSGLCTVVLDFGNNEDGWSQFSRCREATEKNLLDAPQDVQVDLKVESTAYLTFSEHSRQVLIHRPTPDTIGQDHLPLTKFVPFDIWQGRLTGNVTYEPPNESHFGKLYSSEGDTATLKARDSTGRHSIQLVISDSGGRTVYEMTFEGPSMWKDRWQMYMNVLKFD